MQQRTGKAHCTAPPPAGLVCGAREERIPEGRSAVGHPQPRDSNLASARTAELGRAGAPGRPRSTAPTSRPAAAAAQPRAGPSPAAAAVAACGGGGAAPPQPDGSGEQSGGGGGANFFRCLLRAPSSDYLQRRARLFWGKSARASVRVPEQEPARLRAPRTNPPAARAPSSCPPSLPPVPSRLEAGGRGAGARGRGRAARAGPAGSCSSPPRAAVGLAPRGRAEALHPGEIPAGRRARGCARLEGRAVLEPHFAVP